MEKNKAIIILSKCSNKKGSFGIRVEEKSPGKWFADWAFAIQDTVAKKEGYDNVTIPSFDIENAYPGCPYCENKYYFQCSCNNKLSCWNGRDRTVTCGWCDHKAELSGEIESITVGGDR